MTRLRETLNPEEQQGALGGPTRTKTPQNEHPIHCGLCHEVYYVDQSIYSEFMYAVEYDTSNNPFICEECLEEQAEEEHAAQ
jgi:hypothetical protein